MESKGGKKKSSSSSSSDSLFYETPLVYSIEDVRPRGGIKKFRSAAYSNVSYSAFFQYDFDSLLVSMINKFVKFYVFSTVCSKTILRFITLEQFRKTALYLKTLLSPLLFLVFLAPGTAVHPYKNGLANLGDQV